MKDIATIEKVPDYIKQDSQRGSEAVTSEDITIPRLEIVQSLSPARNKKDPMYIQGAEEGLLYNNVSRELYGENVYIVPVIFKKQWLIWKDRKAGGGFRGAYDTKEDAVIRVEELATENDNGPFDINDTAQNLCLIAKFNKDKLIKCEEIAISMSKSKLKVSRQWNSMIRMFGGDRFSRAYQLSAVIQANDAGDKFYNFHVTSLGYTTESVYKIAEKLFDDIAQQEKAFNVNQDFEQETEQKTEQKGKTKGHDTPF